MEVLDNWNNISKELFEQIPVLKTNQVVRFQMLNGAVNLHPDVSEREKQPVIFPKANINFKDRIWDKHKGQRGEWVNIGIWKSVNDKNIPQDFVSFMPWAYGQHPYTGVFFLIGGRDNDDEKFQYLWLCNERKDNPNAKDGHVPLFEMVDYAKENKGTIKKGSSLLKALTAADNMTMREKKDFAAAMVWGSELEEEALTAKIIKMATEYPNEFIATAGDPDMKTKTIIGYALEHDIIKFDPQSGKVLYSGSDILITRLDASERTKWVDSLAEFIKRNKSGAQVLANLKAQLKAPVADETE